LRSLTGAQLTLAEFRGKQAVVLFFYPTGFMLFNDRTYPNFIRLLQMLEVPARMSDMSFSFCRRLSSRISVTIAPPRLARKRGCA